MELLKKEIIEQNKMYTVVNDFPYRFLTQVEIEVHEHKIMGISEHTSTLVGMF